MTMTRNMVLLFTTLLLVCSGGCYGSASTLMNEGGVPYEISNPLKDAGETPFVPDFNQGGGDVEYFDVYGEVRTKYSQVYWTRNNPIYLPPVLVERFKEKVMAIVGYEVDQVRHTGPQNGSTTTSPDSLGGFACFPTCEDGDVSVPIFNQYNHHYFSWLQGKDSVLYEKSEDVKNRSNVPNPTQTAFRRIGGETQGFTDMGGAPVYPSSIVFKENPGGEFRKSYHGYPKGYAQLLASPTQWIVEPMQIDTHNREYNLTDQSAGYRPSFLPKIFTENTTVTDLRHKLSPLIECPCTDRIGRSVEYANNIGRQACPASDVADAKNCARAVQIAVGASFASTVTVISNATLPSGCLLFAENPSSVSTTTTYRAVFNDVSSPPSSCADLPDAAVLRVPTTTTVLVSDGDDHVSLDELTVNLDTRMTTLTITGPHDVWFAIGFNATTMADLPYALVVEVNASPSSTNADHAIVSQRKLANHGPGTALLANGLVVISDIVNSTAGTRQITLTRPLSSPDFDFPESPTTMKIIAAIGNSPTLAYHKARSGAQVVLLPAGQKDATKACVCEPAKKSFLNYMNATKFEFDGYQCSKEPRSDMFVRGDGTGRDGIPNAACHMETYHGGLQCCKHEFFLTDRAQNAQNSTDVDVYFLKWRYYFQEYTPATTTAPPSHRHLHHWVFLIDDAVNDYEEDNAHYGTGSVGKIEAHLQAKDIGLEDIAGHAEDNGDGTPVVPFDDTKTKIVPIVMTPHCHAPSCIRQELWNADTNEILCNATARYGGDAYGSTAGRFNEPNYITISPCLWGDQPGLAKPFRLDPWTNLTAVKYFNNTFRHLGQMAQWTGLMVYETDPY